MISQKKPSRIAAIFRRAEAMLAARMNSATIPPSPTKPASSSPVAVDPAAAKKGVTKGNALGGGTPSILKSCPPALPPPSARPQNSANGVGNTDTLSGSAIAAQYRSLSGPEKFKFFRANRAALKRESAKEQANGFKVSFFARSVIRTFTCGDEALQEKSAKPPQSGAISTTAAGFKKRVLPCGPE